MDKIYKEIRDLVELARGMHQYLGMVPTARGVGQMYEEIIDRLDRSDEMQRQILLELTMIRKAIEENQ